MLPTIAHRQPALIAPKCPRLSGLCILPEFEPKKKLISKSITFTGGYLSAKKYLHGMVFGEFY